MTINSDSTSDRNDPFVALRDHMRSALGDAVRRSIGEMVSALRDEPAISGATDRLASSLWSNISDRIRAAQHDFDRNVDDRLRDQWQAAQMTQRTQAFGNQISQAARDNSPNEFSQVICAAIALRPHIGQSQHSHPLDVKIVTQALTGAVVDVLDDPGFRLDNDRELIDALAVQIAEIYWSTAHFVGKPALSNDGVRGDDGLPIGYDEPSQPDLPPTPTQLSNPPQKIETETESDADSISRSDRDSQTLASSLSSSPYAEQAVRADYGGRQLGESALAQNQVGNGLTLLTTLHPVADMERDAQQFAHAVGELAYSRDCRNRYFLLVRERLEQAGSAATQLALVDLVSAMFNYAIDDRRLTDSAKPLVWRLQQPVLMLTLLDSAYMSDARRSLRALVENFGAIAKAFGDDLTRGTELYRRLETVVRAIEVISNVLYLRGNVLARQVALEYDRAAGGMAQLVDRVERERLAMEATPGRQNRRDYSRRPGRDQERAVTDQLSATMSAKTSGQDLPESVSQFLDKVWLRYMRTALLRDGPDSAEYQGAVSAVDELVWSLRADEKQQGRRELAQRIPRLIERLTRGLHEIGESEDEHQAFFDELFVIHLQKLQRRRDPQRAPKTRRQPNEPAPIPTQAEATEYDVSRDVPVLEDPLDTLPDTEAMIAPAPPTDVDAPESETLGFGATETLMANDPNSTEIDDVADRSTGRYRDDTRPPLKPLIEIPAHTAEEHSTLIRTTRGNEGEDDFGGTLGMTTQIAQPSTEVAAPPERAVPASNDNALGDDPLMGHVTKTDLSDLPQHPRYQRGTTDSLMSTLASGLWIQLSGHSNQLVSLKLAWMSTDKTALLFVRHPDARVIARQSEQIRVLIDQGRLRILRPERVASAK